MAKFREIGGNPFKLLKLRSKVKLFENKPNLKM
jgi:hypothetical protein